MSGDKCASSPRSTRELRLTGSCTGCGFRCCYGYHGTSFTLCFLWELVFLSVCSILSFRLPFGVCISERVSLDTCSPNRAAVCCLLLARLAAGTVAFSAVPSGLSLGKSGEGIFSVALSLPRWWVGSLCAREGLAPRPWGWRYSSFLPLHQR